MSLELKVYKLYDRIKSLEARVKELEAKEEAQPVKEVPKCGGIRYWEEISVGYRCASCGKWSSKGFTCDGPRQADADLA